MSYTKHILKDLYCNYLDAQVDNSEKMLLSCINYQNYNINNNSIRDGTINGSSIIEGFTSDIGKVNDYSSDMSIEGGVGYVQKGHCPLGHTMVNGECHQLCKFCNYTDKNGYFGQSYSQSNNICGPYGSFNGITDNGYIHCKLNN